MLDILGGPSLPGYISLSRHQHLFPLLWISIHMSASLTNHAAGSSYLVCGLQDLAQWLKGPLGVSFFSHSHHGLCPSQKNKSSPESHSFWNLSQIETTRLRVSLGERENSSPTSTTCPPSGVWFLLHEAQPRTSPVRHWLSEPLLQKLDNIREPWGFQATDGPSPVTGGGAFERGECLLWAGASPGAELLGVGVSWHCCPLASASSPAFLQQPSLCLRTAVPQLQS